MSSILTRRKRRNQSRCRIRRNRLVPLLETLEDRRLLAASQLYVDTFDDRLDPGDGRLSLREAVLEANDNPGSTIHLEAGTYELTRFNPAGNGENAGLTGDLDVTASVQILGDSQGGTIIDASGLGDRAFHVLRQMDQPLAASFPLTTGNPTEPAVSATKLNDLTSIRRPFSAGDSIRISGTRSQGAEFIRNWQVTSNSTVGDLIAQVNDLLSGDASVTLDQEGQLLITPSTAGNHQLSLIIEANTSATFRNFPAFAVPEAPAVNIRFVTIEGGTADTVGGGLYNQGGTVSLFHSPMKDNQAGDADPAFANEAGMVTLINSPLINNVLASGGTSPFVSEALNLLADHRDALAGAVDGFFSQLDNELNQSFRQALGQVQIPGLGPALQQGFAPVLDEFAEMRTEVSDFLQRVILALPHIPEETSAIEVLQGALFLALGEGPSGLVELQPDVREALLGAGLETKTVGLGLLQDGLDPDAVPSPSDILVTLGDDVQGTQWIEFGFHAGQRIEFDLGGFSISSAIGDLVDPESVDILAGPSVNLLPGLGIEASAEGGLRIDARWDARLGFGISERVGATNGSGVYFAAGATSNGLADGTAIEEIKLSIEAFAAPRTDASGFIQLSEDIVTTPNLSTTLSLGALQARISDGTPAEVKITAPTGLPVSFLGNVNRNDFSLFSLNFGSQVDAISFEIETDHPDPLWQKQDIAIDVSGSGDIGLIELLGRLNAAVVLAYQSPLPPVSFTVDFSPVDRFFNPGAVTTPFLVLNARAPEINHLTVRPTAEVDNEGTLGPDAFNFAPIQHEDRRVLGMGFGNNAFSQPDGTGNQVLVADRPAPGSGISTMNPAFNVLIGGERTTQGDVSFTEGAKAISLGFDESFNRNITTLPLLEAKLNDLLQTELIRIGLAPDLVRFEIVDGDKFQLVARDPDTDDPDVEAPLVTVTFAPVEQSKFSIVAAIDIQNPDFEASFFNSFPNDQRNFHRVVLSSIVEAANSGVSEVLEIFAPTLAAEANLRLHATTDPEDLASQSEDNDPLQNSSLSDVAATMPNVEFDFVADVKLDVVDIISKLREGESELSLLDVFQITTLKFDNIQLDVGDTLQQLVVPIGQSAAEALEPLLSVIGSSSVDTNSLFQQPIPVISDILDENITLRDILGEDIEQAIDDFNEALTSIANVGESVTSFLESDEFKDSLGDSGKLTFGGLEFVMDKEDPFYFPRTKIPIPTDLRFFDGVDDLETGNFLRSFAGFDNFAPPGLNLDLFSPTTVVNMLTGNPFNIVSFGLPQIDAGAGAEFGFKFENLEFDITANAAFQSNLRIVYDSLGLEQIVAAARSGATVDWSNLLNGLAIQNNPTGFEFGGSVGFTGSGGITIEDTDPVTGETVVVFSGQGDLDLGASLGLELLDPNNDGKLRLDEIFSITNDFQNPERLLCILDVQGNAHAAGGISITAGGVNLVEENFSASTGQFSLQSLLTSLFGTCTPPDPTPVLAEVVPMGSGDSLRINSGPHAAARLHGDVYDIADPVTHVVERDNGMVTLVEPDGSERHFDMPDSQGRHVAISRLALPLNSDGTTATRNVLADGAVEFLDTDGTLIEQFAAPNDQGKLLRVDGSGNQDPDVFLVLVDGRYEKWQVNRQSKTSLNETDDGRFELSSELEIFSSSRTTFNADNKIAEVTDWLGAKTTYEYTTGGELTEVKKFDAQGNLLSSTPYFEGVSGLFATSDGSLIKVWGMGVPESNALEFDASSITSIVAVGSQFDDHFDFSGIEGIPVQLSGLHGNDTLYGGSGNDTLDGGPGNDELASVAGNNVLLAGSGINQVSDGPGDDLIDFSQNDAAVDFTTEGGQDTVVGSRFSDTITAGGNGKVHFKGGFGNDILIGGAGDDLLEGGPGNDILIGGMGNDVLLGAAGNDVLLGGGGADLLEGGADDDVLIGGPSRDQLDRNWLEGLGVLSDDASTALNELDGNVLQGGPGRDELLGQAGDDTLIAGLGDAAVDGGSGQDDLIFLVDDQTHTATIGLSAYTEESQDPIPYFSVESLRVELGNTDTNLTIDGPILPLDVMGGDGNTSILVSSLPEHAQATTIDLGEDDDRVTVVDSQRPLNVNNLGSAINGNGTELIIDRQSQFAPATGTLAGIGSNSSRLSGLGIGPIEFSGLDFLTVHLGSGQDRFTVLDTSPSMETTLNLGPGADEAVVHAIGQDASLIVNGNRGTGVSSNNDGDEDTVTLAIPGPDLLSADSFSPLSFSIDKLYIDNTDGEPGAANWEFIDGQVYLDGEPIIDALGADVTLFSGHQSGGNALAVQDTVDVPQSIRVGQDFVDIQEGADVLSFGSNNEFTGFSYEATVDGLDGASDVAVSSDGNFVYAVGRHDDAVSVYRRADDGTLEFVQVLIDGQFGVDGLAGPRTIGISPSGQHVYVGGDEGIATFLRVEQTGRLVYRGQSSFDSSVLDLAVRPDGGDVYAATSGQVVHFQPEADTGVLQFVRSVSNTSGQNNGIAVGRSSRHVLVATLSGLQLLHTDTSGNLPDAVTVTSSSRAYTGVATSSSNTVYATFDGGIHQFSFTDTALHFEEEYSVDNEVNRAEGRALALSSDGGQLVASFDTTSVDESPSEKRLRLGTLTVANKFRVVLKDEIHVSVSSSVLDVETTVHLDEGESADLSTFYDQPLTENVRIDLIAIVGGFPEQVGDQFEIDASAPDGNPTITFVRTVGDTEIAKYFLSYEVETSTPSPTPTIEPLALYMRDPGTGDLSNRQYVGVDDLKQLDALAVNPANDHIYGASFDGDQLTINDGSNFIGAVSDGSVQSDIEAPSLSMQDAVQTVLSADGNHAYALSPKFGALAAFELDSDGKLSDEPFQVIPAGLLPGASLAITPSTGGTQSLYVTNPAEDSVLVYRRDATSGELTLEQVLTDGVAGVDGLEGAGSIALSADGETLLVAGAKENALAAFSVQSDGTLVYESTFAHGDLGQPSSITLSDSSTLHAYVTSLDNDRILVLEQQSDGSLAHVQTITNGASGIQGLNGPVSATLTDASNDPQQQTLYVAGSTADAITVFDRDSASGKLSFRQLVRNGNRGVQGLEGISSLAVSEDNRYVFAGGEDTLVVFQRDAATGELVILQRLRDGSGGVDGLQKTTGLFVEGNQLYVSSGGPSIGAGGVAILDIEQNIPEPRSYNVEYDAMSLLTVQSAGGSDTVDVDGPDIEFRLLTEGGPDFVRLRSSESLTVVELGDGNDELELHSTGTRTIVSGNDGDDTFHVYSTDAASTLTNISGGQGDDSFHVAGGKLDSILQIQGNDHPTGDSLLFDTHGLPFTHFSFPGFTFGAIQVDGRDGQVGYETIENVTILANPLADAGGDYEIDEGQSLTLDAQNTQLPAGHSAVAYEWGIGDSFGVVTGVTPNLTWNELNELGITDSGRHTVWVKVTSTAGGQQFQDVTSATLTVRDAPPTLALAGADFAEANFPYLLDLSATDPGDDTISKWIVDWGDGSVDEYTAAAPRVTHRYQQQGAATVSVTALDEDGGPYGPVTKSIDIITGRHIAGSSTGSEGLDYVLDLNNPSQLPITEWTIDWGDGSVDVIQPPQEQVIEFPSFPPIIIPPPATWPASHTYADDGVYRIQAKALVDGDTLHRSVAPHDVTIANLPPSIDLVDAPALIEQGSPWEIQITASDPGVRDVLSYEFDMDGDGLFETVTTEPVASHIFTRVGQREVRLRVRDDSGEVSAVQEQTVTVSNVEPELQELRILTESPSEATPVHIVAIATDPGGVDDPLSYEFDFDDDGVFEVTSQTGIVRHVFPDDGSFPVVVRVTDSHGAAATGTITVEVNNLAPSFAAPFSSQPVREGEPFTLTVHASDPAGELDPLLYEFDFDNDGIFEKSSLDGTVSHIYADDSFLPPAEDQPFTVGIRISDDDGGVTQTQLQVSVNNVAPTIELGGATTVAEGQVFTLQLGDVVDPGDDTVSQYIVRWGDGTEDVYTEAGNVTHVYRGEFGEQTIRVLLADEDGVHPLAGQHTVLVTGAGVVNRTLFVIGSDEDDRVTIHGFRRNHLKVHASFLVGRPFASFPLRDFDRIVVYLRDGDDHGTIAGNVHLPVIMDGGSGDDHLKGGAGPNALLGGPGRDHVIGGRGRDLLIGGTGSDFLNGQNGQDALIAGRTIYDSQLKYWQVLDALLAEWTSSRSFDERVHNLRHGSGPILTPDMRLEEGETVLDDESVDLLIGGPGLDWFLFDPERDRAR